MSQEVRFSRKNFRVHFFMKMRPFLLYSNCMEARTLWKAGRHGLFAVLKEEKPGIGAQFASPSQRKEGEDADWKLLECR